MTRKKKLQLYIKELEREKSELEIKISWFDGQDNDVAFFSGRFYQKKVEFVNKVIHTLRLITQ